MLEDFDVRNARAWSQAVASLGLDGAQTVVWRDPSSIMAALKPFLGRNVGHTHLPTGGGHSFEGIRRSPEPDCLELSTGPRAWHLFKPDALTIEIFPKDLVQTFLMLDLKPIPTTDVSEEDAFNQRFGREEVVRLPFGEYIPRDYWDEQIILDGDGNEEPMPEGAVLTIRWLRGRMLFVAKTSRWNRLQRTYDGRHNGMTAAQVRRSVRVLGGVD